MHWFRALREVFRIRCPECGRFYYVPSELASIGERECQCPTVPVMSAPPLPEGGPPRYPQDTMLKG